MTPEPQILLAKIGSAHGVKGEVRVKPFGDPDMLDQYGKLETSDNREFRIRRMRLQKGMAIVKFEGVNNRDDAEALNGIELFVNRSKLPEPDRDEFYISDLLGMKVMVDGACVGLVKDVPNFGADDMIEVSPSSGGLSYYLPFTRAVIPTIDFGSGTITAVPPLEVSDREDGD